MIIEDQKDQLKEKLKEVFGYGQFRGEQERIIQNVLTGKNTFVIMPTGAGKSLCYQLPAVMQGGTAIVISPLIALMKNQVDQLNALGVSAFFLNSTLTKAEMTKVKQQTLDGKVKLLYVAPESLTKEENVAFLQKANVSFVAIDEAHCISEWGHDFRPEYRRIKSIIGQLGNLPIIALTATATPKVQLDIQKNLQMEQADVYKSSFNRTNLYYEVRPKTRDSRKQLVRYVKQHEGKSGIVYCLSRKKVEEIAEFLVVNNIKAAPYHAGLDSAVRMRNQDAFLNEEVDVVVATIAFGMGIDKPDVRFVIHYDPPKSLEGYYQETGRAGRDGLEGNCIMFYKDEDIVKLEKFNKDKPVTERDNARFLLQEVAYYSRSGFCHRKQLLHYFGEVFTGPPIGTPACCDNCRYDREKYDGTQQVITALKTVKLTGERFLVDHLANVIRGIDDQYVLSYGHNELDVYGAGKDDTEEYWRSVLRQVALHNLLEKDIEQVGVLRLTKEGHAYLQNPAKVELVKDLDFSDLGEESFQQEGERAGLAYDEKLFALLKTLRKKVAKEKGLPPYVVFQDPSLEEMATTYPQTQDELLQINGVGRGKAGKFGKPFLQAIKSYVEENEITTANDVLIKSSGQKSKIKIFIIQQIDRKVDLEEIANAKSMPMGDLLQEIENICYSGTRLNLDYYLESMLDEEKQDDIFDYFMESETDDLEEAIEELGDDYTEEEIRLMRVKFLSEIAN